MHTFFVMEVREGDPGGLPVRCLPDLLRENMEFFKV